MVFVLQTESAARRWPASDEALGEIERAFAACTPSSEALAKVAPSERVHRGGGARKKRKMKRAGKKTKAWKAGGKS